MELLANLSAYKMQVHTQPVPTSLSLQSSELKTYLSTELHYRNKSYTTRSSPY